MLILIISIGIMILSLVFGEIYNISTMAESKKATKILVLSAIIGFVATHLIAYPTYMGFCQPAEPSAAYEILESEEIEVVRVDNDGYYAVTGKGEFKKIFNNPNFKNAYIVTEEASPFDSKYPKVYKETYRPDYDWLTSLIPPLTVTYYKVIIPN